MSSTTTALTLSVVASNEETANLGRPDHHHQYYQHIHSESVVRAGGVKSSSLSPAAVSSSTSTASSESDQYIQATAATGGVNCSQSQVKREPFLDEEEEEEEDDDDEEISYEQEEEEWVEFEEKENAQDVMFSQRTDSELTVETSNNNNNSNSDIQKETFEEEIENEEEEDDDLFDDDNLSNEFEQEAKASHLLLDQNQQLLDRTQEMLPQSCFNVDPLSLGSVVKVRKRSANQAYEYLTSLPNSASFQQWITRNETDFTWVHKRNSMTNIGKKFYYICNFRIKKGYFKCPAVIYALFPVNGQSITGGCSGMVMVYGCGEHEHRRADNNSSSSRSSSSNALSASTDEAEINSNRQNGCCFEKQIKQARKRRNDSMGAAADDCGKTRKTSFTSNELNQSFPLNPVLDKEKLVELVQAQIQQHSATTTLQPQPPLTLVSSPGKQLSKKQQKMIADLIQKQQQSLPNTSNYSMDPMAAFVSSSSSSSSNNSSVCLLSLPQSQHKKILPQPTSAVQASALAAAKPAKDYNNNFISNHPSIMSQLKQQQQQPPTSTPQPYDLMPTTKQGRHKQQKEFLAMLASLHHQQKQQQQQQQQQQPFQLQPPIPLPVPALIPTSQLTLSAQSASNGVGGSSNGSNGSAFKFFDLNQANHLLCMESNSMNQQTWSESNKNNNNNQINDDHQPARIPRPAMLSIETAPVHLDVGGHLYTTSLATLTKHGHSRLSQMFNGTLPVVLDTWRQHYFIDRDGKLFRHVLNFMRTGELVLPANFDHLAGLLAEAKFYGLDAMVCQLNQLYSSCSSSNGNEKNNSQD